MLAVAAALCIASCGSPPARPAESRPAASREWVVRVEGVGPATVGAALYDVWRAGGGSTNVPRVAAGCDYVRLPDAPAGVLVMIVDGQVARIDVTSPGVATDQGVSVGSPAAMVHAAYPGRVVETPHKYTQGRYLIIDLAPATKLVFETGDGRVTRYRVGRTPEVGWVEGCS